MIRILHVINGAGVGGISSMLLNYYRYFDRESFHFDFVTSTENGHNGDELEKLGSRFYCIGKKSDGLLNYMSKLSKIIRQGRYDVVHVHSNLTSFVALFVAWKNRIPIRIAHGHNAKPNSMSIKEKLSRYIGNSLIELLATEKIACSLSSAIYTFGKKASRKKKVKILPNAIDLNAFGFNKVSRDTQRMNLGIPLSGFAVGCVGRMSSEKNQEYLIQILPDFLKKVPNAKLVLVGDGDCRRSLESLVIQLGCCESVIFTGERTDVCELLSAFDVFTLPSLSEGLGIVAIEAAASGLPMILSENVTKELSFIPASYYVPLANKCEWISILEKLSAEKVRVESCISKKILSEHGYDILKEVEILERVYQGKKVNS